jgi:3-dehydroquinate synthetase
MRRDRHVRNCLRRLGKGRPEEAAAAAADDLAWLIAEAVKLKAEVVSSDERESGLAARAEFWDTRLGTRSKPSLATADFKHGEAVAWGMIAAARYRGKGWDVRVRRRRERIVRRNVLGLGPLPEVDGRSVLDYRAAARKRTRRRETGVVHFVLPTKDRRRSRSCKDVPDNCRQR